MSALRQGETTILPQSHLEHLNELTNLIFDNILMDYSGPVEKIYTENNLSSINVCQHIVGSNYRGKNRVEFESV